MQLMGRFEIVGSYPAVYIERIDAVVIADLHLGLESLMAREGTYMPKFQLDRMKEDLTDILERTDPETLIVCGDIKHEFSETSYGEREEVQAFIDFVSDAVDEILLVKGNHDNYLIYPVDDYDNVRLEEYFVLDDMCFLHGHEDVDADAVQEADYLVIGHEHPALTLTDEVGITEKLPCFLYGEMADGRHILVLPAFSKLAEGSQINRIDDSDLLSPILQERVAVQSLQAVGVDRDAGLFEFPAIGKIREVSGR